jgi:hypothetical protein
VTLSGDIVQLNPGGEPTIYLSGGAVTFCHDTVKDNYIGGGIYIAGASVGIDQFTVDHTVNNSPPNIEGWYYLIPNC